MPIPVTVLNHDARQLGRETAQLLFDRLSADVPATARTLELPVPNSNNARPAARSGRRAFCADPTITFQL